MKNIVIEVAFDIGQRVFFPLNPDARGLVIGYTVRDQGTVMYDVFWEDRKMEVHRALELSAEPIYGDGRDRE